MKSVTIVYLSSWACPLYLIQCVAFVSQKLSEYGMTCAFHRLRNVLREVFF